MSQRNRSKNGKSSHLRHRKSTSNNNNNKGNNNNNSMSPKSKKDNSFTTIVNECPFECDCKKCQIRLDRKTIEFYRAYIIDNLYSSSPYRLRNFNFIIDLILFGIGALYVVLVPYTKVEESFNMQAAHDMLFYGYNDLKSYDHYEFPGQLLFSVFFPLFHLTAATLKSQVFEYFLKYFAKQYDHLLTNIMTLFFCTINQHI